MALSSVRRAAIIGTGTIGASWTSLFLAHGLKVVATDVAPGAEDRLRRHVEVSWPVLRETLQGTHVQQHPALDALTFVKDIQPELGAVDWVQENGPEQMGYKQSIFRLLDEHTRPHVVLASSSSGLPSSAFAASCKRHPERVLIGHPFNPPHIIPLVEIVPHAETSPAAVDAASAFYKALGKDPVVVQSETPGFVGNRMQAALVHEAYSLVSRGIISAADVDTVVSSALALRWAVQGPFLTKVLGGGGGGIAGFKHHLATVGAAAGAWARDMQQHAYVPGEAAPEATAKLIDSVAEELEALADKNPAATRDAFLVEVLRLKRELSDRVAARATA